MAVTYYYTCELQVKINEVWITVATPTVNLAKYVKCQYLTRVYEVDGSTTTRLTNSQASVGATRNTTKAGFVSQGVALPNTVAQADPSGGWYWITRFEAVDAPPFTLKPSFQVETSGSGPAIPITTLQFTAAQTTAGVTAIQAVNYSLAAVTIPKMPDQVIAAAGGAGKANANAKWDEKKKEWVVVTYSKNSNGQYQTVTQTFDVKGQANGPSRVAYDKVKKGPNYKKGEKLLLEAIKNTYTKTKTTDNNPAATNVVGVPPTDESASFNPPNHFFTRLPSFEETIFSGTSSQYPMPSPIAAQESGAIGAASIAAQMKNYKSHKLGRMIQDAESAKLLSNTAKGKQTSRYGFRFTYNPQSISYNTTANTPIDWTLGTSDTANILGGPTVIAFDLYLNRVADLAELNAGYISNNYPGGPLSEAHRLGLKTRGTEYDLEYLYRIVNGDPVKTALTSTAQLTSDFGYITGVPFWLYLHDNMRYYVGLSSMAVNHMWFTKDMVPMFTVVQLTFQRYPVFDDGSQYIKNKQAQALQDSQANKTTTTTTGKD